MAIALSREECVSMMKNFLVVSFIVGVLLIVVSFFLPPMGVIDPSVLKGAGIIFTFSGVVYGLASNKIIKYTHKDTTVYIGDKTNE